jgi:FkbM family methyltransferase
MMIPRATIKAFIRRALNRLGYDLIYYYPPDRLKRAARVEAVDEAHHLVKLLTYFDVNLVLDVGANIGQFAQGTLAAGYQGRIVSFEPLFSAHTKLKSASRTTARWHVHERCAFGDTATEMSLNVASNSQSSSLLEMLSTHQEAAPRIRYTGAEKVAVLRLDDVAPAYISQSDKVFLKLDVQGYEKHVLRGASQLLPRLCGAQLEMSLVPLYRTETPFEDMLDIMFGHGFEPWALFPGFGDHRTGRMLQVNGVFFRAPSVLSDGT